MSGRAALAAHFEAVLPDEWRIIDHDDDVTLSGPHPAVMVYTESVQRGTTRAFYAYTLTVVVMCAKQAGADVTLEAALAETIKAVELWDVPFMDWTEAERSVYLDRYPAWKLTVQLQERRPHPGDGPT